jgi:hypothetical protein
MFESGGNCTYCSLFSMFLGFTRLLHPSHILNFFFSFSSMVKEYRTKAFYFFYFFRVICGDCGVEVALIRTKNWWSI